LNRPNQELPPVRRDVPTEESPRAILAPRRRGRGPALDLAV